MAERLTEVGMFIDTPVYKIKNGKKGEAVDKLAKLEDILEKYGIESLDELSNALEFAKTIEQTLIEHGIKDNEELDSALIKLVEARAFKKKIKLLETDRDAWKRACELASSHISWCPAKQGECNCAEEKRDCTNFFYQQAKKEKDENKN